MCFVASLAQLLLKNALKLTFKKGPRIRAYFRMQWQQYSDALCYLPRFFSNPKTIFLLENVVLVNKIVGFNLVTIVQLKNTQEIRTIWY